MSDPLQVVHSAEQPSYEELREQYRADNRKRVHAMLREDTISFRDAAGNYLRDKDGNVVQRKTGYLTDAPVGHEHQRVDDWRKAGGFVPEFTTDFSLPQSAGLQRELRDLERDATAMAEAERVLHPEVTFMGGPPLAALDEESVVNYMDQQLKESDANPEAKCSSNGTQAPATSTETGTG